MFLFLHRPGIPSGAREHQRGWSARPDPLAHQVRERAAVLQRRQRCVPLATAEPQARTNMVATDTVLTAVP